MDGSSTPWQVAHRAVPGRLRLTVDVVRGRPERAERLSKLLAALPEIAAAEARALTGSLVLHFDPAHGFEAVLALVRRALAEAEAAGWALVAPASAEHSTGAERCSSVAYGSATEWFRLPIEEAIIRLGADPDGGLSEDEARRRLARHGPNVMPRESPPSALALFAKQFTNLPVGMLVGSAVFSLATGGAADAMATLTVVVVNGVLGYVTEGQAERVIHGLVASSHQSVQVTRDGEAVVMPASNVVPGDVLLLHPGAQVAADARMIAARTLMVDESSLTGESMPVEKAADADLLHGTPLAERRTMVYAGTIIAEGTGRAVVVATGARTEAARTHLLSTTAARPHAPVEVELDRLGRQLAWASLAACALFIGLGTLRGTPFATMLKDALALAVAAVPEGLPMVATTTLSLGLKRMQRKGILIRRLDVVESLGAIQTICLDKTGTLTQNRMEVIVATLGVDAIPLEDAAALAPLAEIAALNSEACLADGQVTGSSQTEQALLNLALDLGVDATALRAARPRVRTVERAPARPWMVTVHGGNGPAFLVKGAPEALLARCDSMLDGGTVRPLGEADRIRILDENDRIASRPARVLGFARRDEAPEGDALTGLTFVGLVGMIDPIRPGAPEFIHRLHSAGIDTVLITGDQAATASATARELGLGRNGRLRVIDSTNLGTVSPELLAGLAGEADVFARVASYEKLAIVQALQATGRVVAMTGDGVNDGPALNAADVGIAMGRSGTELARDVANVVISDDELATLIEAIAQGRSIYRNIRRSLEFLVTTNASEIIVSLVEAVHGPNELETPMELLWMNMVTDVLPGLGLALADPDPDIMRQPPRPAGEPIVPRGDAHRMGRDSSIIAGSALVAHFVGLARYGPGPRTRGMTFLALSQAQLLYTLACQRRDPRQLRPDRLFENRTLDLALLASTALGILPFLVPWLRRLLGIAPLGVGDAVVSLAAATVPLASVLARRGILLTLEEEICATSC